MRRFIYLDTDVLNSYLAQIHDGLIQTKEMEKQYSEGDVEHSQHNISGGGQIAAKLFGNGVEGKLDYSYEHLKETNNTDLIRDVQTKIIHDNAFDQLISYLDENQMFKNDSHRVGEFIGIKDDFFILDLEYYKAMFEKGGFIEYLKKMQAENTKNQYNQNEGTKLSRDQRRVFQKEIDKSVEEAIKKNDKEYESMNDILHMLTSVIPYKRMLCIQDFLVVLNDNYLRDSVEMLAFKYGGKVKVVGYVTNIITNDEDANKMSVFAGISNSINTMMKMFFDNREELFILHPIAIYYE